MLCPTPWPATVTLQTNGKDIFKLWALLGWNSRVDYLTHSELSLGFTTLRPPIPPPPPLSSCPLPVKEWCFLCGQLIIWVWPSAVFMQDPIRQPAGWNHHHRPPPIPFRRIYLFPFTSCFWILRIDFYMYMCVLGIGLRMRRRRRVLEDTLLMGEWRAAKWRAAWLNACPSLPILLVTGGLSFSRPAHICLPLYDSLGSPICMFDRQQTGLCMSK